jgi:multiple sugar transport system permease protein
VSRIRRMLFVSGILLVCAWTLVPIYLVALGGIGGAATVYAWPKPFWPAGLSFANFAAFLQIEGLWPAMLRSIEVAVMCMALSLLLGAPAGYALARFAFRGANVYRLMILMTRAFLSASWRCRWRSVLCDWVSTTHRWPSR